MNQRRVVVTGIGMLSPLGVGNDATWQGLIEGRSGIVVQVNGVLELFSKSSGTQKAGGLAYLLEPPLSV